MKYISSNYDLAISNKYLTIHANIVIGAMQTRRVQFNIRNIFNASIGVLKAFRSFT